MRENNLIIICVTVIICIALIAGTFIIINNDNTDNQNDNSDNSANDVNSNNNQNTQSNENTASSNPSTFNKINWATFYADGNPNTGEQVTINVGSQYAN